MKIERVTIDYKDNPLVIDGVSPQFGWTFQSGEPFNQAEYRILVADTEPLLLHNVGNFWDSETVQSANHAGIVYQGRPLQSRMTYYVKICIRGVNGESLESGVYRLERAIDENEWLGEWVSVPTNYQGGALYFRKAFYLQQKVRKARAYVCGLGYHEAYLNGQRLDDSVLQAAFTNYDKRVPFCTYDLTNQIEDGGVNVFGVILGHGWYGRKVLKVQVYIEFENGSQFEFHTCPNNGWCVKPAPMIEDSIFGGEVYDARREIPDWCQSSCDTDIANDWMYAIVTSGPKGKLVPQTIEPIVVDKEYIPTATWAISKQVTVYQLEKNISGFARITVTGERGARVTMRFAERVSADGNIDQTNLRTAKSTDVYILKGEGIEVYQPRFTFHGFQYIEVGVEGDCECRSIVGLHIHTNVQPVGTFSCSDARLTALHEMAVNTESNNVHGFMSDCPQRDERFGWLNDLGSRLYQNVYNFDMANVYRKVIQDIADTQNSQGAIADTAPYAIGNIPADPVCICYLMLGKYLYRYYGDKHTLAVHYGGAKAWVDYLLSRSKNYIMEYFYYADWVAPYVNNEKPSCQTDGIFVSTCYLYWHLKMLSECAEILDKDVDKQNYFELAEKVKTAIHTQFYHEKESYYCTNSQGANSLAVSLKLAPMGTEKRIVEQIVKDIEDMNEHSTCGNICYRHMFYVLGDYGYADLVCRILVNSSYPGWGYMLANGATTVWERWEKEVAYGMNSFDHPMFASFDGFFYEYLGGIRVDEQACAADKITIAPVTACDLQYVTCSFKTIQGKIVSEWKKEDAKIKYHIEIPPCTSAKICIDGKEQMLGAGEYWFEQVNKDRLAKN